MLELGFAKNSGGQTVIPETQLERIINLDESCLSLDRSQGRRGGRPCVTFFDPALPSLGKCATKSSITTTIICGSSAAGEPLPPHLQFSTNAKVEEREKIRLEIFKYIQKTRGKFGRGEESFLDTSVGLNEKGGMDDNKFEIYLVNLMEKLYLDAYDGDGYRVIVKIDSGPGRSNMDLLARL